jgi:predicted ArsR family transcriptional regulator
VKSQQAGVVAGTQHAVHEGSDTRDRVARLLLENGSATAAELATGLEITPAAVRRHLDTLLAEGLVEAADRAPHGPASATRGPGRPAKVFSLTDEGRDAFEQAYDDLAAQVLHFLREHHGEAAVEQFARARVSGVETRYAAALTGTAAEERLSALAGALSADGFAASTRPAPGSATGEQICQHHCPVAHVAAEFPQLCEAETAMFGRLLGTHVQRLATIAHGDGICTTHVPAPPSTWIDGPDLTAPSGRHAS